jgi:hypothetical protein
MTTNNHVNKVNENYRWQYPENRPADVPCAEIGPRRVEVVYPLDRKTRLTGVEACLQKKSMLLLTGDHSGETLSVSSGGVWVTQSGNPEDIILRVGDSFGITRKGTVLVEGVVDSRVKINGEERTREDGGKPGNPVQAFIAGLPDLFV